MLHGLLRELAYRALKNRWVNVAMKLTSMSKPVTASMAASTWEIDPSSFGKVLRERNRG